jgi:hypothetical protein
MLHSDQEKLQGLYGETFYFLRTWEDQFTMLFSVSVNLRAGFLMLDIRQRKQIVRISFRF